uniref:Uncharacterized protein n=1 Tax=Anguilla anguilla TaxID=7936 RepID=A0A0E9VJ61_ANGAN
MAQYHLWDQFLFNQVNSGIVLKF